MAAPCDVWFDMEGVIAGTGAPFGCPRSGQVSLWKSSALFRLHGSLRIFSERLNMRVWSLWGGLYRLVLCNHAAQTPPQAAENCFNVDRNIYQETFIGIKSFAPRLDSC